MRLRRHVVATGLVAAALVAGCTAADPDPQERADQTSTGAGGASTAGVQTEDAEPTESTGSTESTEPADPTESGGTTGPTASTESTGPTEPTASPTPTGPFDPREITVVMNGDMLLHEGLWATAEIDAARTGRGQMDFRPLLASMRPVVKSADLSICHMETPLAPPGGPFLGYPVFAAPPAIVPALRWEGFDVCTTASNHSIDQGFEGLTRTLDRFEAAGIETVGTAATRPESREPLILDVDGVTVGLISATYGTNGIPLPEEAPWSVELLNTEKIARLASRARADGADVVMVALHWGLEYTHEPTADQIAVAEELTSRPEIDLIYGHHAHVVQPYGKVNGNWVIYGLGNAIAQQDTAVSGVYDGNTSRVTFVERRDGSFRVEKLEYLPTMITTFDGVNPMRWLNVPASLDDPSLAALHDELQATSDRVTPIINMLGAFRRGVTEVE